MRSLIRLTLCCVATAALTACGDSSYNDPADAAKPAATPATPAPSKPASGSASGALEGTVKQVGDAARNAADQVSGAVKQAAASKPAGPTGDELLQKQYDWAAKRLEGLNMARGFINDEKLSELVDEFSGQLDVFTEKMNELDATPVDEREEIREEITDLVAEIKVLDKTINDRVKSIKP